MRRKTTLFLLACLLLFWGGSLSVSGYRRWQAEKLLACVSQFHPGVTTEAQTRSALRSFVRYGVLENDLPASNEKYVLEYQVSNSVAWLPRQIGFPWTLFIATIKFSNGLVEQVRMTEMQEDHPGFPHPSAASVWIDSYRLNPSGASPNGFSEYSRTTGSYDAQGHPTGFACCHEKFIHIDERATPAEFAHVHNFQLSCMTSFKHCDGEDKILP